MRLAIDGFFRWYDLWIGLYVDTHGRAVYICPLPAIGLKIRETRQQGYLRVGRLELLWRGGWEFQSPDGWRGTVARWGLTPVNPPPPAFRWWIAGPVEIRWHYPLQEAVR